MKQKNRTVMILVGVLAIITTALSGCKKAEPVADFTFQTSVVEGKVLFFNKSKDADSYAWDFGDGETSTLSSPDHFYEKNGTYNVTLQVRHKNGTTHSKSSKVQVTNVPGGYMFWMSEDLGKIDVTIDYVYRGTITVYYYNGTPDCGDNGCVTVELPDGSYNFKGTNGAGDIWEGSIRVESGICKRTKLQ